MVLMVECLQTKNDALKKLKTAGLSVRQIERLTGVGRNNIQRAK